MLANPGYTIPVSNPAQNVDSIDIDGALAGNLFKPGFNFSLPGIITPGPREIVSTNRPLSETGPRIWLDDAGFSVSVDQTTTISATEDPADFCPVTTPNEHRQVWLCNINNTQTMYLLTYGVAGQPEIWWDDTQDLGFEFLTPNRQENPWTSLGTGGDTAVMKQVFTVTKGRCRHTFLETVIKVSMFTLYPTPFNETEITDMVRRMWSDDTNQSMTPDVQKLVDIVVSAQNNQTSLTFGTLFPDNDNYTVASMSTEFLNVVNAANTSVRLCSVLRTTSTNITLIRSDTLDDPVMPFEPCPGRFFTNIATGGRVRSSTCHKAAENQTNAHFQGQLDTSSMLILTDVLGDGTMPTSAIALNQTGVEWYNHSSDYLDQLLTSRGFILGGDRTVVAIEVKHNEAALSYLQLLLVVLPVLFAFAAWIIVLSGPTSYYAASFLAAVCTTTHVGDSKCSKVGYLHEPPEISLSTVGDHVLIRTPTGVLTNVGAQGESAYIMTAEPLLMKEGGTPTYDREWWREA